VKYKLLSACKDWSINFGMSWEGLWPGQITDGVAGLSSR
jgi:hypothetical protein